MFVRPFRGLFLHKSHAKPSKNLRTTYELEGVILNQKRANSGEHENVSSSPILLRDIWGWALCVSHGVYMHPKQSDLQSWSGIGVLFLAPNFGFRNLSSRRGPHCQTLQNKKDLVRCVDVWHVCRHCIAWCPIEVVVFTLFVAGRSWMGPTCVLCVEISSTYCQYHLLSRACKHVSGESPPPSLSH